MVHQSLIAKLDGAFSATSAAGASFATESCGLGVRAQSLSTECLHRLEPALSCPWHHGSAKASSLCSFLQDNGRAQDRLRTSKRSPQQRTLGFSEAHAKSSKQATTFMFTPGQQQPMMGQFPQQPMGQPQQPMMGQQPQQPMMGQQQPTMDQQPPMMGQQPMGQPNYQQPMGQQQQQPMGQNYGGSSSQGNNNFGNSGGDYNNGNTGGSNNSNNGGGNSSNTNSNSNNSSNNNNSSSGGSSSNKGKGGAVAAGILVPVVLAALGGVVAYMMFCRGGRPVEAVSPTPSEPDSEPSDDEDDDDDDATESFDR
mmetsp:Transcript_47589/g.92029  ORF Transcript_47589/g.92029 Transcript_47589/m.92029 type:complete len:310 (+) Transcript_47589:70-999(+)